MFSAWYPTKEDMLLGNFVQNHAKAIATLADVIVIHPIPSKNKTRTIEEKDNNSFHEIFVTYPIIKQSILNKSRLFLSIMKSYCIGIQYAIKKYGLPDICHVHIITKNILPAIQLQYKYNIPFIITEHWSRYLPENEDFNNKIQQWMVKFFAKKAVAITTVSPILANAMQKLGIKNQYFIIPNVLDENIFRLNNTLPNNDEQKSILMIIHFDDNSKNWKDVISTIALLSKKRKDFRLDIIGDGKEKPLAIQLVEKLQISNFVCFHSTIPNENIPEYFHKCCFSLLFSNFETQGLVLIESLACGKPIVASRLPAIEQSIGTENGILVEPQNKQELLFALDSMLDKYKDYSPENLRQYAINRYSTSIIAQQFIDLYSKVLNNK